MSLFTGFLAVLCLVGFISSPCVSALLLQPTQNVSQGLDAACPCSPSGVVQNRLQSMEATLNTLTMAMSNVNVRLQTYDQNAQAVKDFQRSLSMLRVDLHGLASNISKLNTDMNTVKKDVDNVRKHILQNDEASDEEQSAWRMMIANISSLQSSLEAHGAGLNSVSSSMTAVSNALNSMSTLTNIMNSKVDKVEQRVDMLTESRESSLLDLSQAVDRLRANVSSLVSLPLPHTPQVAFSVRFTADPAPSVDSQRRYLFDHIITNIGKGYDPATGQFSAPVDGVYIFFLTVMSVNDQGSSRVIITTSTVERLADVWNEGKNDVNDKGSALVTARLQKGEKVWVRSFAGTSKIRGGPWSVFSGFLIQAIQP